MRRLFVYFFNKIYDQIVRPILISVSPIHEVALGMGVGMFVGLTPTVGVQMWIVLIFWLFAKYILKIRFDLIIGTAVVWISNPFTMFFMYYGFLVTGLSVFSCFGISGIELSYATFSNQFLQIVNNPDNGFFQGVWQGTRFLIFDLGKPMLIGSFCYAIPASLLSYFLTYRFLLRYRKGKAAAMGMEYETWRKKFEKSRVPKSKMKHPP